jgi:hypothetical protein
MFILLQFMTVWVAIARQLTPCCLVTALSDGTSSFTSPSVMQTLTLRPLPWSYSAAVKEKYIKRLEERTLSTLHEYEPLPVPSKVKPVSPHTGPKFMHAYLNRPEAAATAPQYFAGFEAAKYVAPLQPREGMAPGVGMGTARSAQGGPAAAVGHPGGAKTKGKPLMFSKGAGNKVLPIIQRNTMEQLRQKPATIASIHDVMASDETPLAARGYTQLEAEKKVSAVLAVLLTAVLSMLHNDCILVSRIGVAVQLAHRVKVATDKARGASKLLQADALNKQLKWQRTRGTKDYLRVERGKKITSGMQKAARCIQRAWKRYVARVLWASVRRLRPKVAVALIRTYSPDLTDAPVEGALASRRRENKVIQAAKEAARLQAEAHEREMRELLGPDLENIRRAKPKLAPMRRVLAGEEFIVPRDTLERLRNAALGWLDMT